MKTKYLKALIIDQDPAQSRTISTLIKDLFNQIHITPTIEEIKAEYKDVKSRVLFINLTVPQRTSSFELLEKLEFDSTVQTIIFGYTDGHEPELITHAIEEGVSDIFVKPFDADIVATKINKFFVFEKTQGREIGHSQLRSPLQGQMQLPLKITSVDENGFQFRGEHFISKGAQFKLSEPLVQEIFEEPFIELMVTKTWMGDQYGEFFFYAEPKLSNEKTSSAFRRFILRKL